MKALSVRLLISKHFAILVAVAVCITNACAGEEVLPNVVLLMGDDHGWDETGYNGHPYLKTPVLDEMATQGLRLERFYSAASSCSPTRGSIITGRHPNRYGTFAPGYSLRPEEIGIAQLLTQAGYACGHFGKWHLGPVKASSPTNPGRMGFQKWLSHDNFFELNPILSRDGLEPQKIDGESSEIVIREAIQFADQATQQNKPFFIVVWFGSPHEPYSGLPKDLALYDSLPSDFANKKVSLTSNETGQPVERLQRDVLRERFAEITAMDRAIGLLRTHLNDTDRRDNTLLWYCGDNGTPSEAVATVPFRGRKGNIYEGGIRVPGIIEWPKHIAVPRASKLDTVTSDMFPTLCDLAGVALPDRPLDGMSLKPLLEGSLEVRSKPMAFWNFAIDRKRLGGPYIESEMQKGTTPLAKLAKDGATRNFENYRFQDIREQDYAGPRAIVENGFKLVIDGTGKPKKELFNLATDPSESKNLIGDQTDLAKRLEQTLRQWQTSVLESLQGMDY
jgi:arylsulfatase A-like enzyme